MFTTARVYFQGEWKDVQVNIQRFLRATALMLCIDLVGTSDNRIPCVDEGDLHSPCTNTKNWSRFELICGVQDSCSFLVLQLVPAKPIASAA
jgi:hypothetical protein